jgi:hypothetical protein
MNSSNWPIPFPPTCPESRAAARVVGRQHLTHGHLAVGLVFLDLLSNCLEAEGRVAQEDNAQQAERALPEPGRAEAFLGQAGPDGEEGFT